MKKVLLYSIKPEHLINILNGKKTIEIRKSTLPKWALEALARGESVEAYGYCTKGKPYLIDWGWGYVHAEDIPPREDRYGLITYKEKEDDEARFNGLVVVKYQVSGVTKLKFGRWVNQEEWNYRGWNYEHDEMLKGTCLTNEQLNEYGDWKKLYAHHLTNIQPIEPMELSNFYSFGSQDHHDFVTTSTMIQEDERKYYIKSYELRKSPQSYMTCWVKGE